ncbi:MAG: ABC transporter substrate-binding protein [Nitrospiria bacterium]
MDAPRKYFTSLPFILTILTAIPSFAAPAPSLDPEVTVIISQDLPIYQQALAGFKKIYTGRIQAINLKGNPNQIHQLREGRQISEKRLILTIGLIAAKAVKKAYPGTPTVFSMVFDPERFSLKDKKTTGVSLDVPSNILLGKIKELFWEATRIGILYDPQKNTKILDFARQASRSQEISLVAVPVRSEKALSEAIQKLEGKIDLLWMIPDSTVITPRSIGFILLHFLRHKIPIVSFSEALVRKGSVAAFSPDYGAVGEEAGRLVLQVLKGKSPAELPIRSLKKTKLTVNLKTAKKMGVSLNPQSIKSADHVYK